MSEHCTEILFPLFSLLCAVYICQCVWRTWWQASYPSRQMLQGFLAGRRCTSIRAKKKYSSVLSESHINCFWPYHRHRAGASAGFKENCWTTITSPQTLAELQHYSLFSQACLGCSTICWLSDIHLKDTKVACDCIRPHPKTWTLFHRFHGELLLHTWLGL